MKILLSAFTLDLSGVPTYTLVLYNELVSLGHSVEVYSPHGGELESKMKTVKDIEKLTKPDIILAQHQECAESLYVRFSIDTPIIFLAHGSTLGGEQPPKAPMHRYIVINEITEKNLIEKGIDRKKIFIVRDFLDVDLFMSDREVCDEPRDILYVSNYRKDKTFATIENVCKELGIKLHASGAPYGRSRDMVKSINQADLVISSGRVILEAMSCERPVISFDKGRGWGYINRENYFETRQYNFGWPTGPIELTEENLKKEIRKFNPYDGEYNRELVMFYHNSKISVNQLLELIV
jgi:hypothetical protein